MTRQQQALDKLTAALKRAPMTARAISRLLGCCRPTAYQYLRRLKAIPKSLEREKGATGPSAVAYGIR